MEGASLLNLTLIGEKNPPERLKCTARFGEAWFRSAVRPKNRKMCSKCFVSVSFFAS